MAFKKLKIKNCFQSENSKIKPAQCITLQDTVPTIAIAQPGNTMPPI